ncbi:glycine--tRNA ligase beta subunit [Paenibacillus sp. J31TS4]|uniref:glycine--tRNA ligase subunit beta n=1 Tax=Paenibacillus sp. J31TS4 TaxID=2807195 RepID=UPI001B07C1E7|nr:glycine--tRNA ligase subunit beta [Paenibacillus sp. J31TS4]GIP39621.1 glycine--tRNA ligase beta subunit [Paenibacillus sp. J31TS4]
MAKDLLLEIGMEEVPARFVRDAVRQLVDKTEKWLADSRIAFGSVHGYATPRRLAVLVKDIAEKQEDLDLEVKGPSRKIALDAEGGWSKAALGFARSQGVAPEDLFFKELAGVEYVHAKKNNAGQETSSILTEGLEGIIHSLTFPKNMRWGTQEMKFVRPIRWLVALYGTEVVSLTVAGVEAGRQSQGHRFLGAPVELPEPALYVDRLREQYVYADPEERQELILKQLRELSDEKGWTIAIADDLLEEVVFLVEYPTALYGSFHPDFLTIPQEVLITSMREHQRYFPVLDDAGKLQPFFVTVRNGNRDSLEQVARGNEKVLRARLSDAKFFYEEDQKGSIDGYLSRLETIVFHEELGTVADKVRRVKTVAARLADLVGGDAELHGQVERTAAICKFDLVTQMVYEFPELQGVMGQDYARKFGESEAVANAIFEHYQPRFSADASPASLTGALVSMADKIDTIAACIGIGIVPTGSQDPYALRRQAAGIVQILLDHQLPVQLSDLFGIALDVLGQANLLKSGADDIRHTLMDFFGLRVKNLLAERGMRYDVVEAVMAAGFDDIASTVRRAEAVTAFLGHPDFKATVESFNRVANLAAKAGEEEVREALFEDPAEGELWQAYHIGAGKAESAFVAGNEAQALASLTEWREPITVFFERVMVMAENEDVRHNRLALLLRLANELHRIADFSKLVW